MNQDKPVADTLRDLSDALERVTEILNGLPIDLSAPLSPAELEAIRTAPTAEQQQAVIAEARAAGRQRLRQRLADCELIHAQLDIVAVRLVNVPVLLRRVRASCAEFIAGKGSDTLDELERLIGQAEKQQGPLPKALKSKLQETAA